MEESGNGKLDHTHEAESEYKDDIVLQDVDELKSQSVREIVVEESNESVNGTQDADADGSSSSSSSSSEDEAEPEEQEKEKDIVESVVDPVVEDPVENLEASSAVDEIESKEIEDESLPSADESDGVSPLLTDEVKAESTLPFLNEADEVIPVVTYVEETSLPSNEADEVKEESTLPSSNEAGEVLPVVTDVGETSLPSLSDVIPLAVLDELPASDEKVENSLVDEETKESVDRSVQPSADIPPLAHVENIDSAHQEEKHEILQSTQKSPIISVSKRTVPPTSWKSCCGIFDVLRRSDR